MARFQYSAVRVDTGRIERGVIEAPTLEAAARQLRERRRAPTQLAPVRNAEPGGTRLRPWLGWTSARSSRVSRKQVTLFTRQLATLLRAGVPLVKALAVVARQERSPALRNLIGQLADAVGAGGNLSDALARSPRLFDRLFVNMVKAGERSGALAAVLERLAAFQEKSARLKGRIASAMVYPAIIMGVAATIVAILMVFVVPKFEGIFTGLLKGQPLPGITRGLLTTSHFIASHAAIEAVLAGLLWISWLACRRTDWGSAGWDRMQLRMPLVGDLVLKAAVARFARTLGSLLTSGVPLLEALAITATTAGNRGVTSALEHVRARVEQGEPVTGPLEETGLFPATVVGMVQVGEETGELAAMLVRVADTYDEEVDQSVAALTAIVEPVMIVVMAFVVGIIVIALFLPIMTVIQHLG